jgi:ORMDL family
MLSWLTLFLPFSCVTRLCLLVIPGIPQEYAWTIIHVTMTLVQFHFFHWVKGTPYWAEDNGKYDDLTFWEQIDDGVQYTPNRKFLTVVPLIVYVHIWISMYLPCIVVIPTPSNH